MSSAEEDSTLQGLSKAITAIEKKFYGLLPDEKIHGLTGMMKNGIEIVKLQGEIKAQQH